MGPQRALVARLGPDGRPRSPITTRPRLAKIRYGRRSRRTGRACEPTGRRRAELPRYRAVERSVAKANCYDITTEDGFVYLPEHDVTVSNCDDQVVLLGSMVMGVGIPVQVLKQTFGAGDQEHVLLEAQDDNGNWFPLDPSTDLQAGSKAPASSEFRLDPSNPSMIGLKGTPEAEFIGVGAISNFRFVGDVAPVVFWTPVNIGLAIVAGSIAVGATAGLVQRYRKKARR